MLDLARRTKARIFQASTSEIYGNPTVHPQVEDYWGNVNPIGPRSCYDEGKRCAETLFFDYHRQYGRRHPRRADLQHLRAAHAPQRRTRRVQFRSCRPCAASRSPSTGDGSHTRSFCYAEDLIQGFVRLMAAPRRGDGPNQPRQSRRVSRSGNSPRW